MSQTPFTLENHYQLGITAAQAGDFETAIEEFRTVIDLDPAHIEVRYKLAWALGSIGEVDQALEHFRWVIDRDPDHKMAHYNLGACLLQKAQLEEDRSIHLCCLEEAKSEFQAVLRLDPEDQQAYALVILIQKALHRYQDQLGSLAQH
jgi:tetratricopeptide (TPR) repeat protein